MRGDGVRSHIVRKQEQDIRARERLRGREVQGKETKEDAKDTLHGHSGYGTVGAFSRESSYDRPVWKLVANTCAFKTDGIKDYEYD